MFRCRLGPSHYINCAAETCSAVDRPPPGPFRPRKMRLTLLLLVVALAIVSRTYRTSLSGVIYYLILSVCGVRRRRHERRPDRAHPGHGRARPAEAAAERQRVQRLRRRQAGYKNVLGKNVRKHIFILPICAEEEAPAPAAPAGGEN